VVGANSKQPLTLVNRSAVTAMLYCDLSDQPEFELQLFKLGGEDDAGGGAQTDKTSTVAGDEEEAELPLTLVEQAKELKGGPDQSADGSRAVSTSPRPGTLTLHPTPYTLHPTPYTLHPTPYTLHPTPYTLHPTPSTLPPTPYTLHPTPLPLP
jgi:hypothetical protein